MRGFGWYGAVALSVAAMGCGSTWEAAASPAASPDQHEGPDAVCAGCSGGADGQVTFAGKAMRFTLQAGTGAVLGSDGHYHFQPGAGGIGASSVGTLHLDPVAGGPGLTGTVDTAVSCGRTNGVLRGTFSGTIDGQRFTLELTDGAVVGLDPRTTVAFTAPEAMGPAVLESGFLHVASLFECRAPCGEGQCWCVDGNQCESCADANHGEPLPTCLEGTCWTPASATCEPCASQPSPPVAPVAPVTTPPVTTPLPP